MNSKTAYRLKDSLKSILVLLVLVGLFVMPARGAQPLGKDDITLLLIGGASQSKMINLVEKRGVDFQLTPDLIEKFHKLGASQALINAIIKSNRKSAAESAAPATEAPTGETNTASGIGPQLPGAGPNVSSVSSPPSVSAPPQNSGSSPVQKKINHVMAGLANGPGQAGSNGGSSSSTAGSQPARPTPPAKLSNPSPAEIQKIIHAFAAKELMFKEARDNYTYRQINKVETLNADGQVDGVWQQDWDILFDNQGHRIEKVTYAPPGDLKGVLMTEQDYEAMRHTQPFVLTTNDLNEYDIKYLGHVPIDYLTAYVFSVRPKKIEKHHEYFQGVVWVDDKDLQIVKTEGRQVPEIRNKHGENLFPRFSTWRKQIDGKFWFPVFTLADDTLYFPTGPVHIKEIIRYTDYKQFRSTSVIKAVKAINSNTPIPTPTNPSSSSSSSKSPPKH